jgi:hypothetical protein
VLGYADAASTTRLAGRNEWYRYRVSRLRIGVQNRCGGRGSLLKQSLDVITGLGYKCEASFSGRFTTSVKLVKGYEHQTEDVGGHFVCGICRTKKASEFS